MSHLHVVPVISKKQQSEFLDLPHRLHGHLPHFTPALRWDESRLLGFSSGHPLPQENCVAAWLVYRDGKAVARIAGIDLTHSRSTSSEGSCNFGFFAGANDLSAARLLLHAVAAWAISRGYKSLQGPFSPSINYSVGLLQEGFDRRPSLQIPTNPEYYDQLLTACGLTKCQDLYALHIRRSDLEPTIHRLDRVAACLNRRCGVSYRQGHRGSLLSDLLLFLDIAQRSLASHWGFAPLSIRERKQLVADLKKLVIAELLQFSMINGREVGAALALPDVSQCIREISGRLWPWGWLKLILAKHQTSSYRLVAANILPQYSRLGLAPALVGRILKEIRGRGGQDVEFSWIAESNPLSFKTIENGGAQRSKVMRVYQSPCEQLLPVLSARPLKSFAHMPNKPIKQNEAVSSRPRPCSVTSQVVNCAGPADEIYGQ